MDSTDYPPHPGRVAPKSRRLAMKGTAIVLGVIVLALGGAAALGTLGHARWGWCPVGWFGWPGSGDLTLAEVPAAVERYLAYYDDPNLAIGEIMEFTNHFYVEVREADTGQGAMELLVLRDGSVRPEPGPNMMWNTKYGHRGMMGFRGGMMGFRGYPSGEMTITPAEARDIAQRYLDRASPGLAAEEVKTFPDYYTIHTVREGAIVGMLSVHGATGEVWVHTWHGTFVRMSPAETHEG
jgi:hypothetical protein